MKKKHLNKIFIKTLLGILLRFCVYNLICIKVEAQQVVLLRGEHIFQTRESYKSFLSKLPSLSDERAWAVANMLSLENAKENSDQVLKKYLEKNINEIISLNDSNPIVELKKNLEKRIKDAPKFGIFSSYSPKLAPESGANYILEDDFGNIWFSSSPGFDPNFELRDAAIIIGDQSRTQYYGRILIYQKDSLKTFSFKDGLPSNYGGQLFKDSKGNIWIPTPEGILKNNNGKWTNYGASSIDLTGLQLSGLESKYSREDIISLFLKNIKRIYEDSKGRIWFLDNIFGPFLLSGETIKPFIIYQNNNFEWLQNFFEENGIMWFSGIQGVFKFKNDSMELVKANSTNSHYHHVTIDKYRKIWATFHKSGIGCYNEGQWDFFDKNNGLQNNTVVKILIDSKDNKWIISEWGGITKYDGQTFTIFNKKNGFDFAGLPVKTKLVEDGSNVWLYKANAVSKFDGISMTSYSNNIKGAIRDLKVDKNSHVWISNHLGSIYGFKEDKFYLEYEGSEIERVVYEKRIFEDNKNNLWYIQKNKPENEIIWKFYKNSGQGWKLEFSENRISRESIFNGVIYEDSKNRIWIGFNDFILKYETK